MGPILLKSGTRVAVIALGGNAILRKGQEASPRVQIENLRQAVHNLEPALDHYNVFALTHGNGPQVGNDLIRSYAGAEYEGIPELNLTDCVANTQGRIGHWLVHELRCNPAFDSSEAACILTHVYVNKCTFEDKEYTKYVGPWRPNTPEVRSKLDEIGIRYKSPAGSSESIRRVVPSPEPYAIEEIDIINRLLSRGVITICCGGGGIPVYNPNYEGNVDGFAKVHQCFKRIDVVIDKDRASAILAQSLIEENPTIDVDLIILADIRGFYRSSAMSDDDYVPSMSLEELTDFMAVNDLDPGSIGPKIESVHRFLASGGRNAYLGPLEDFEKIFDPSSGVGTHFYNSSQLPMFNR